MTEALAGKTTVVIGASSGIGLAVAHSFHDAGATVHALARREPEGSRDDRFLPRSVDATDRDALASAIRQIGDRIDVLVYSAGYNVPARRLAELSSEDWNAIVRVNLDGAYYALSAALAGLRKTCGTAIFISSAAAAWPNVSGVAYQASKIGLLGLTRAGAYEEHEDGIRLSVILPGVVDTPHLDRRIHPPSAATRAQMLKVEDVASACLFLATLPPRAYVPELHLLPTLLQAPGKTQERSIGADDV